MRDVFIVNPTAGTGYALTVMEKLETVLKSRGIDYSVLRTERPGHATELARAAAAEKDVRAVISVGGDGTAFEVASGLADTGMPLGIIPAGTGNDFIKAAGLPKDPLQALETVLSHRPSPVDMGSLNEGSFLNVCGTGFDVTVLDQTESFKSRFKGLLPYFLGLLKAIAKYKPVHLKLCADGVEEKGDYLICSIANGRYIGGGIPICPVADITDGKLNLVTVKNVPRRRIPLYLPGLMLGKVLNFKITTHRQVKEVSFEGQGLRVNIDGEIVPMDRAGFAVRPGVLQLLQ